MHNIDDEDIPGDLPPVCEPTPAEYQAIAAARHAEHAIISACVGVDTAQNTLTAIDTIRDARILILLRPVDFDRLLCVLLVARRHMHEYLSGVRYPQLTAGLKSLMLKVEITRVKKLGGEHPHTLWDAANAGTLMFHDLVRAVCINERKSESEETAKTWNWIYGRPVDGETIVVPFPGRLRQRRRVDVFS